MRSELLPLVIDRDLRVEYIASLEAADKGELSQLASLFARLERGAIMQGLSVDVDAELSVQRTLTSAVIESLANKFNKRREAKHAELRAVNNVAEALRSAARKQLEVSFEQLEGPVSELLARPQININDGGPDYNNGHWYKYEVIQSANAAEKFANFAENHYFVKASICVDRERLIFVTSFHHVGRELSGIMEATAFAKLESFEGSEDREYVSQDFFLCSVEPFVFTYKTSELEIEEFFVRWLDAAVAVAFKEYGDRL